MSSSLKLGLFNIKEWITLSNSISPEELYDRLTTYWNITLTLSGLTAGFTFIITSTNITFTQHSNIISISTRYKIFGSCLFLAFLLSLTSGLLSILLLGYLNLSGKSKSKWYTQQFWILFDIPITLTAIGLLLMLIASLSSIGGLYPSEVWYIGLCFGLIFSTFLIISWIILRHKTHIYNETTATSTTPTTTAPATTP